MGKPFSEKDARFIEAYQRYYPLVYGSLFKAVGHDAADLVHDVFELYYRKVDEVLTVGPWLVGVVKNVISNHISKRKEFCVPDPELLLSHSVSDASFMDGCKVTSHGVCKMNA